MLGAVGVPADSRVLGWHCGSNPTCHMYLLSCALGHCCHWVCGVSELVLMGQASAVCCFPKTLCVFALWSAVSRMSFCFVCLFVLQRERKTTRFLGFGTRRPSRSRLWPRPSLVGLGKVNPVVCHVQSGAVRRQDLAPPPSLEKTNPLSTHSWYIHLGEIMDMSNSF